MVSLAGDKLASLPLLRDAIEAIDGERDVVLLCSELVLLPGPRLAFLTGLELALLFVPREETVDAIDVDEDGDARDNIREDLPLCDDEDELDFNESVESKNILYDCV